MRSVLLPFGKAVPHPRNYRSKTLFASFGLHDRWHVRESLPADLVIFDPARVRDQAEFKKPHHYNAGPDFVFVNGAVVVGGGEPNAQRPGRVLRRQ